MYRLLAAETGRVHVCGHRGHIVDAPENTMAAFRRAVDLGATSLEIDVVMSSDGEIVVLHDTTVDRTTDGKGFASDMTAAEITALDAGSHMGAAYADEPVPLLSEVMAYARANDIGVHMEIKDKDNEDALIARLRHVLEGTESHDWCVAISFDHQQLAKAKVAIPGLRTEGITHARHVAPGELVKRAGLDSVSVEFGRFEEADGRAIHDAGVAIRCHLQRPHTFAHYAQYGRDYRAKVGELLAAGVIDVLSGDDVAYLKALVDEFAPG